MRSLLRPKRRCGRAQRSRLSGRWSGPCLASLVARPVLWHKTCKRQLPTPEDGATTFHNVRSISVLALEAFFLVFPCFLRCFQNKNPAAGLTRRQGSFLLRVACFAIYLCLWRSMLPSRITRVSEISFFVA